MLDMGVLLGTCLLESWHMLTTWCCWLSRNMPCVKCLEYVKIMLASMICCLMQVSPRALSAVQNLVIILINIVFMPHFIICGSTIEMVDSWSHVGHVISRDCDDKRDIMNRRTRFISQVNNIICVFGKLDCVTKMRLLKAYCSSFMALNSGISLMTVWRHWIRPVAMHLDEFSTFLSLPTSIYSIYWTTTNLSTMYFVNDH